MDCYINWVVEHTESMEVDYINLHLGSFHCKMY